MERLKVVIEINQSLSHVLIICIILYITSFRLSYFTKNIEMHIEILQLLFHRNAQAELLQFELTYNILMDYTNKQKYFCMRLSCDSVDNIMWPSFSTIKVSQNKKSLPQILYVYKYLTN